eukprot:Anaeramoba_flamelloidesc41586_g1_i2.p1 GENE.c41586_g1_i2~~c41586_g1_i2.p1  ORF type:complete len:116 (-),score=40.22 c41586_g1_i2:53-400(-)
MKLKLNIKPIEGELFVLEIEDSKKVKSLKKLCLSKIGVATVRQRLIHNGKILENERTLKSYEIEDEDKINLVVQPEEKNDLGEEGFNLKKAQEKKKNNSPFGMGQMQELLKKPSC